MTREPAWWCGLAAFSPAATIAKFTFWWPSARMRADSSADTSASVRPDERDAAGVQLGGDAVDRCAGGGERIDLGLILHHPQRSDHVDGAPVLGARELRQQLDEEPWPTSGRRRRACERPDDSPATTARRVVGLAPRQRASNTPGCSATRGASSRGMTSVASPSRGTTSIVSRSSGIAW